MYVCVLKSFKEPNSSSLLDIWIPFNMPLLDYLKNAWESFCFIFFQHRNYVPR